MRAPPILTAASALAAVLALLTFQGTTSSCDEGGGSNVCARLDAGPPDFDAGLACHFPCRVASPGDDAGGDTYASFAQPFFAAYCTRCHSTARTVNCFTAAANCRNGAPRGHDWDDPASLRAHLQEIRGVVVADDPFTMPPDIPPTPDPAKPDPPCEQRYRLARWIDSGAPGLP